MKYRLQRHTFILRSKVRLYWPIIPKDDVHTSDSLQDIIQSHWTMKYRSQIPMFVLRSKVGLYWFIIPNNDVHTSNSIQDIRQNHWITYIRHSELHLFWGQMSGHTDSYSQSMVYIHQNSLQDIRQNHWTEKYRSCWPSLHDPQVHVTRLSHDWPTICISCFHNRKSRQTLFKGILDIDF